MHDLLQWLESNTVDEPHQLEYDTLCLKAELVNLMGARDGWICLSLLQPKSSLDLPCAVSVSMATTYCISSIWSLSISKFLPAPYYLYLTFNTMTNLQANHCIICTFRKQSDTLWHTQKTFRREARYSFEQSRCHCEWERLSASEVLKPQSHYSHVEWL